VKDGGRGVFQGGSRRSGKVFLGPAISYQPMPCGQATPGQPKDHLGIDHSQCECIILFQKSSWTPQVIRRPEWQGVSMDSLKFHLCPPCPILLCPMGGPPPKRPYGCFGVGPPAGRPACGHLLPPWIPHALWAWSYAPGRKDLRSCTARKPRLQTSRVGRNKQ
jgi:hypothetical protein